MQSQHLKIIVGEAIHVIREVHRLFKKPALLFSGGKDSTVLLDLCINAFYPQKIPFPLIKIQTGLNFIEVQRFQTELAEKYDLRIITQHIEDNHDGRSLQERKTQALKKILINNKIDAAIGGGRREEDVARSKELFFSKRDTYTHCWSAEEQPIQPWKMIPRQHVTDYHYRVFPLNNWTEINIWEYISKQNIKVAPLYYSHKRKVIEKGGVFLPTHNRMSDDELNKAKEEVVRFRSLGDVTNSSAMISKANSSEEVLKELMKINTSERASRFSDHDLHGLEKEKRQGYF
jgi:sulfate adenylyltransferase subunit 2